MKKRLLALLLCAVMACALLVPAFPTAAAAEVTETDKEIRLSCTDTCVAVINKETGALTFEGDGDMVQGYKMKVRFSDYSDYIRKVTLKAGMFEIPSGAFENCTRLESVNLFSASAIYENAFKNCSSLKDIKITGNVNYISGSAFAGCISITKFDLSTIAGKAYRQQYPIDSDDPKVTKEVDAQAIWKKIVHNAWKSAEPGVLFWDTIIRESVPDCYADLGFKTVSTNPCGEIPLCPYDSCRLLAINLYSYVVNPFTKEAYFDFDLFRKHVGLAQRMMDDIIDLEMEKVEIQKFSLGSVCESEQP